MNAKQKLHQVHLQEWAIRFAVQKASGLTVRQWCEQNSLSFHTYNYWKLIFYYLKMHIYFQLSDYLFRLVSMIQLRNT